MFHLKASEETVQALMPTHQFDNDQAKAVRSCVQSDLDKIISSLEKETNLGVIGSSIDSRVLTQSYGLETIVEARFETDDALVTLSAVEEALKDGLARVQEAYLTIREDSVQWQTMPTRGYVFCVEMRFNDGIVTGLLRRSAPPASAPEEPEPPPDTPNRFERVGVVDDPRATLRKRDQLAKKLLKRAAVAEDDDIATLVQTARAKTAKKKSPISPAAAVVAVSSLEPRAFSKMTVLSSKPPRGGISKAGVKKHARPDAATGQADGETGGGGFVSRWMARILAPKPATDKFVADYSKRPQLFQRVAK
jgi:hypothetical protein